MESLLFALAFALSAWDWIWSHIHGWTGIFAIAMFFEIGSLQSKIRALENSVSALEFERNQRQRGDSF